ncbi:MAG: hypothetical protein V2I43_03675 [Parvularcula sp.]|nr:hypothetical protein [Parvularcula sp.]
MRLVALFSVVLLSACAGGPTAGFLARGEGLPADDNSLVGAWEVTYTDRSEEGPNLADLVISNVEDGKVEGSMADLAFLTSRATVSGGELRWAGTTQGEDGPLFHEARLVGRALHGSTLSIGHDTYRGWTATLRTPG